MYSIIRYSEKYKKQYCDLYISTWQVEPYGELFTPDEALKSLEKNNGASYLLVEEKTDKVIGFVAGRPIKQKCSFFSNDAIPLIDINKAFYISQLGVAKEHKKHGWGQTLILFLISNARENNFSEFILTTHANPSNPAIALYNKLGFSTRNTKDGKVHGREIEQNRIDSRPLKDFRIYFYKVYS
jgi:ribosomal protein S18 acetylase RimI-like enzyme